MTNELKYNGYSANPSDYECKDGDLALAIGVVPEDGGLRPVLPPSIKFTLSPFERVIFVHKTTEYIHYIYKSSYSLRWRTEEEYGGEIIRVRLEELVIYQISAIGNTLVILSDSGIHYALWNGDGYVNLGKNMPEPSLSFGLRGSVIRDKETHSIKEYGTRKEYLAFKSDLEWCSGRINKFIADNATNDGKFVFPFFVRYALRLYDGTLTHHSAPILMLAPDRLNPLVVAEYSTGVGGDGVTIAGVALRIAGMVCQLDYITDEASISALSKWKDIVRSVDIFVSAPIYTYNQNAADEVDDDYSINVLSSGGYSPNLVCRCLNTEIGDDSYRRYDVLNLYKDVFGSSGQNTVKSCSIFCRDDNKIFEDIKNESQFYLLKSINIEDLSTTRTVVDISSDYLKSLMSREVMTDDYDSHDVLIPRCGYVYNARLNLANINKKLFCGFASESMFCKTSYDSSDEVNQRMFDEVYIVVKRDGREIVLGQQTERCFLYINGSFCFFYYPDANATAAYLRFEEGTAYSFARIKLNRHDFLNGAYSLTRHSSEWEWVDTVPPITSNEISLPNKLYTSEVNNPFFFSVLGINTVGLGEIIGIRSAAKALSEGQFGQFPLYVFTSEGVWALEVSTNGYYSAKQPITRDVCINQDSITQIDSAVLFATNRGIMHISGSGTQCITDTLNAPDLFSVADLPKDDALISVFNRKAHDYEQLSSEDITMLPFLEFLSACRMIYDYTHQRIIVYNPTVRYAYVYSLKSHMWGMVLSDIEGNVNSYPEALAMALMNITVVGSDGQESTSIASALVDFTQPSADCSTGLIITRPFKMGEPNMYKTIDTIIQRGFLKRDNFQQVLYGSNDLYNWHVVWSSNDKFLRGFRGTPYKFFRLAVVCSLNKSENLYGCTIQFNPRRLNQPR